MSESARRSMRKLTRLRFGNFIITIPATEVMVVIPEEIERRLGVESYEYWWTYWTATGDEAMVGRITELLWEEFDSDWQAYLQLMDFNPHLRNWNLGSSDEEAEDVLLMVKDKAYIVRKAQLEHMLLDLWKQRGI